MRIEVEHTHADWRAFCSFHMDRTRRLRWLFWATVAATALLAFGALAMIRWLDGPRIDALSMLAGVALVYVSIVIFARVNRAASPIPESWLGRQVYELLPDALHTTSPLGKGLIWWSTIREVTDSPAHLFVCLDNVTSLVLPKRDLERYGGSETIRAEIERLRGSAAPANSTDPASPTGLAGPTEQDAAAAPKNAEASTTVSDSTIGLAPGAGSPSSRMPALLANLLAGLRLVTFLPVRPGDLRPSAKQTGLLIVIALGLWPLLGRLTIDGEADFVWFAVAQLTWLAAVATLLLLLMAPRAQSGDSSTRLFTAVASVTPYLTLIGLVLVDVPSESPWVELLPYGLALYFGVVIHRAQRVAISEWQVVALARAIVIILVVTCAFAMTVYTRPQFWYSAEAAEEAESYWDGMEAVLFGQPDLIDAAVERVAAGTEGRTETYFLGFAGFGEQQVFDSEIRFADEAFGRRIDLAGRSLHLINSPGERDPATPLATASGLERSLAGIARKMNVDEDILLLFLTSHGSENAQLSVSQDALPLEQLDGETLRAALDDAGIQWRIIVISACHSGSFIPFLSTEQTLIITAAHSEKASFGCSDERDLTYFGEALLRDALPVSSDLLDAVARTRKLIGKREEDEGLTASQPQTYLGEKMKAKLAEMPFRAGAPARSAKATPGYGPSN